ncbi:unnamed protein product [Arctia plantaginis]|uniref:BRCA1-associated ATM activator 1 n=1 Tax=Arctia plantaginis TaxID=874455 RepID=A0A8S1B1F2_ARCPL|nr:unnamed protein product [Arctia plantaginis]CAB3253121.1 unnamed protein product [Arctia plantaginis]
MDQQETSLGKLLLDTPAFADCIFHSVANISHLNTSTQIFLIKLATFLFKSELLFMKIQIQGFQNSSLKFFLLNNLNSNSPAALHLACIELFTMLIVHRSGVNFLLEHKIWQVILYPDVHRRPKPISVATYNFITKLVWKLHEYNSEMELIEVLDHTVKPILRSEYLYVPVLDTESDKKFADKIYAQLNALLAVMSDVDNYAPVNNVMLLLRDYFLIDQVIYGIFEGTKNKDLLKLINAFLCRYSYGLLRHLLFDKEIHEFCNKVTASHRNYVVFAIKKRESFIVIDYIIQYNIMWSGIEKLHGNKFDFPLTFEQNEETGISFSNKITIHSLKELLRLKDHLNPSQTGTLFQSLHYLLEVFISCDEAGQLVLIESPMDPEDLTMLTHLLNALKMMLKEYNISWYENVEIVSIQADLLNLLKQTFLTTKHVVQVLDMLDICMQKFLSPSMTLLVDINSTPSNTLNEIGKVILLYTQHEDWEVRDSALNLLKSCTEIAFVKYNPLQKVIKANNLIIIAAKAALTDTEFYPQCTALRCLAAAIKINSIWQEVLITDPYFYYHLVYILKNHEDGMVRTEAAKVLTAVYANQKFEPRCQSKLYENMMYVAIDDLHWEVQLAALYFWKQAIQQHFTNRGMLDGKFPSVTFSKEKRKIIVLNDREIQRQLTGIMNNLADIGCLTVLSECMNVLHNTMVMEQAYCIAKELIEKLDENKFEKMIESVASQPDETPSTCTDKVIYKSMDVTYETSEQERDTVIDDILKENQGDLIMKLYDNYDEIKSEKMDIDAGYCPRKSLIGPNQFLESFRSIDYSSMIEGKKKFNSDCVNSFDGLLDEMLSLVGIN